jgi:hypothetical protein
VRLACRPGGDHLDDARTTSLVAASHAQRLLAGDIEPVVAGMAAASFTEGGTGGAQAPTPAEVAAFLTDDDACRSRPFTGAEQVSAAAAVTWTLADNARCQVGVLTWGAPLPEGPALDALAAEPEGYLRLRW